MAVMVGTNTVLLGTTYIGVCIRLMQHYLKLPFGKIMRTMAPSNQKLPVLYLMDSIMKNIKGSTYYRDLFKNSIVNMFASVFEKVDEKTRQSMYKLRQTWVDYFGNKTLFALDTKVTTIDPAWPVTAKPPDVPTSIHVNPKFLTKGKKSPSPDIEEEIRRKQKEEAAKQEEERRERDAATARIKKMQELQQQEELKRKREQDDLEALMREQLLSKQQELIKLQQERLELELMEARSRLEQQTMQLQQKEQLMRQQLLQQLKLNESGDQDTKHIEQSKVSTSTNRDPRLKLGTKPVEEAKPNRDPRLSRDPRISVRDPRSVPSPVPDAIAQDENKNIKMQKNDSQEKQKKTAQPSPQEAALSNTDLVDMELDEAVDSPADIIEIQQRVELEDSLPEQKEMPPKVSVKKPKSAETNLTKKETAKVSKVVPDSKKVETRASRARDANKEQNLKHSNRHRDVQRSNKDQDTQRVSRGSDLQHREQDTKKISEEVETKSRPERLRRSYRTHANSQSPEPAADNRRNKDRSTEQPRIRSRSRSPESRSRSRSPLNSPRSTRAAVLRDRNTRASRTSLSAERRNRTGRRDTRSSTSLRDRRRDADYDDDSTVAHESINDTKLSGRRSERRTTLKKERESPMKKVYDNSSTKRRRDDSPPKKKARQGSNSKEPTIEDSQSDDQLEHMNIESQNRTEPTEIKKEKGQLSEDLAELFGSEDQDYRKLPPIPKLSTNLVPPDDRNELMSPSSAGWSKFKATHPEEFPFAQPRTPAVIHRQESEDCFRPPLLSPPTALPNYGNEVRKPLFPDSDGISPDQAGDILKQAEGQLRSGKLSQEQHQNLVRQLAELHKLQKMKQQLREDNMKISHAQVTEEGLRDTTGNLMESAKKIGVYEGSDAEFMRNLPTVGAPGSNRPRYPGIPPQAEFAPRGPRMRHRGPLLPTPGQPIERSSADQTLGERLPAKRPLAAALPSERLPTDRLPSERPGLLPHPRPSEPRPYRPPLLQTPTSPSEPPHLHDPDHLQMNEHDRPVMHDPKLRPEHPPMKDQDYDMPLDRILPVPEERPMISHPSERDERLPHHISPVVKRDSPIRSVNNQMPIPPGAPGRRSINPMLELDDGKDSDPHVPQEPLPPIPPPVVCIPPPSDDPEFEDRDDLDLPPRPERRTSVVLDDSLIGPDLLDNPENTFEPQTFPWYDTELFYCPHHDPRWLKRLNYVEKDQSMVLSINKSRIQLPRHNQGREIDILNCKMWIRFDEMSGKLYINDEAVYTVGDPITKYYQQNKHFSVSILGGTRNVWLDGMQYQLNADAPPQEITLGDNSYQFQIDSRRNVVIADGHDICPAEGTPKKIQLNYIIHEIRFDPPPRPILLDGKLCELDLKAKFPFLVTDGVPHGIRFIGPPRQILIDRVPYMVALDKPRKARVLGPKPRLLAFGGPGHEIIIDDTWYEVKFGAPPKEIKVGMRTCLVEIRGKPPEVKIMGEYVPVSQISARAGYPPGQGPFVPVDEPTSDARSTPPHLHHLQEDHRSRSRGGTPPLGPDIPLGPDGRPIQRQFGQDGRPLPLLGPNHGNMMINQRFQGPRASQNHPRPLMGNMQNQMTRGHQMGPGVPGSNGPHINQRPQFQTGSGPNVPQRRFTPPPQPQPAVQPPANTPAAPLNVNALLSSLINAGIIQKQEEEKQDAKQDSEDEANVMVPRESVEAIPDLSHFVANKLKKHYRGAMQLLSVGIQCASCGLRFVPEQKEQYKEHLDWHFRQNKRGKDEMKMPKHRHWYYSVNDWVQYEEIGDLEQRAQSAFFEQVMQTTIQQSHTGSGALPGGIISCPAVEDGDDTCAVCGEVFEQFWDEDEEEWHLRDAIRADGKTYHPVCYEDVNESNTSLIETPSPDLHKFSGITSLPLPPIPTPDEPEPTPIVAPAKSPTPESDPLNDSYNTKLMDMVKNPLAYLTSLTQKMKKVPSQSTIVTESSAATDNVTVSQSASVTSTPVVSAASVTSAAVPSVVSAAAPSVVSAAAPSVVSAVAPSVVSAAVPNVVSAAVPSIVSTSAPSVPVVDTIVAVDSPKSVAMEVELNLKEIPVVQNTVTSTLSGAETSMDVASPENPSSTNTPNVVSESVVNVPSNGSPRPADITMEGKPLPMIPSHQMVTVIAPIIDTPTSGGATPVRDESPDGGCTPVRDEPILDSGRGTPVEDEIIDESGMSVQTSTSFLSPSLVHVIAPITSHGSNSQLDIVKHEPQS